jgi:hypothetical protein
MGIIHLSEKDLHRIISESVKHVISEMDELDWKTKQWAADERKRRNDDVMRNGNNSEYAQKYQKQGLVGKYGGLDPKAMDQQRQNQKMAADEFNKNYGYDDTKYSDFGKGDYLSDHHSLGLNLDGTGVNRYDTSKGRLNGNNVSLERHTARSHGENGNEYNDITTTVGGYNGQVQTANNTTMLKKGFRFTDKQGNQDLAKGVNDFLNTHPNSEQQNQKFRNADSEVLNYRQGNYNYQKGKGWVKNN